MEWLTCIRSTIAYMEDHLEDDLSVQDIADQVYISPFFLQRGFSIVTGYGLSEYLRNRRLYQAAVALQDTDEKVIDIAYRYGYETPESFTKAFSRFHGATPSQVRSGAPIKVFLPLKVKIVIQGGHQMDYTIKTILPFKVVGFQKIFDMETAYEKIPEFWDEFFEAKASHGLASDQQAISKYDIGEYGVCIDDIGEGKFRYLIAGKYTGGEVPEGMVVYEFPQYDWAVFDCFGPIPEALQSVNTRIFQEWLPGNQDFELCGQANVEWYDCPKGETTDDDYHSAIWVPVKRRS